MEFGLHPGSLRRRRTYELFRHYCALPSARDENGHEVAAVRGILSSVLGMIRSGATHIAVATDHMIRRGEGILSGDYFKRKGSVPQKDLPLLLGVGAVTLAAPHCAHRRFTLSTFRVCGFCHRD